MYNAKLKPNDQLVKQVTLTTDWIDTIFIHQYTNNLQICVSLLICKL